MDKYPFVTQDRVYLRDSPDNTGTISAVDGIKFVVSWDSHGRKARESRLRLSYLWANARLFKLGNPVPPKADDSRETDNG